MGWFSNQQRRCALVFQDQLDSLDSYYCIFQPDTGSINTGPQIYSFQVDWFGKRFWLVDRHCLSLLKLGGRPVVGIEMADADEATRSQCGSWRQPRRCLYLRPTRCTSNPRRKPAADNPESLPGCRKSKPIEDSTILFQHWSMLKKYPSSSVCSFDTILPYHALRTSKIAMSAAFKLA